MKRTRKARERLSPHQLGQYKAAQAGAEAADDVLRHSVIVTAGTLVDASWDLRKATLDDVLTEIRHRWNDPAIIGGYADCPALALWRFDGTLLAVVRRDGRRPIVERFDREPKPRRPRRKAESTPSMF